jgi:hypothetical protein
MMGALDRKQINITIIGKLQTGKMAVSILSFVIHQVKISYINCVGPQRFI